MNACSIRHPAARHPAFLCLGGAAVALSALAASARADSWDQFSTYYNNVARAAAANDAGVVARLVAGGGYKADNVDDSGRTGLQIAAINGNLQIAAILIKAGANVNRKDGLGNTALHAAVERNQIETAELLIDIGADLNSENRNGMTPLMIAAREGNTVLVRKLIEKGADARKTDFTGRDAVSWAQESRRPAVVQLLQRAVAQR
jgi:ankyrin repeat protein